MLHKFMTTELTCPKCGGRGTLPDPRVIGAAMRELRVKAGVPQKELARSLKLSAPYLVDLEAGRRAFNSELVTRYKKALEKL